MINIFFTDSAASFHIIFFMFFSNSHHEILFDYLETGWKVAGSLKVSLKDMLRKDIVVGLHQPLCIFKHLQIFQISFLANGQTELLFSIVITPSVA